MHTALFANNTWLDEEMKSFGHLVVGLMDEQVRVAQVLPEDLPAEEASAFGDQISWRDSDFAWIRMWRLLQLRATIADTGVDLLHALDGELWDGVARLARRMDLPAVFTANAGEDVDRTGRIGRLLDGRPHGFAAATHPIREALASRVDDSIPVVLVRPGVRVPDEPPARGTPDAPVCAVITGTGRLDADYRALIEALRRVLGGGGRRAQLFLDARGSDQHHLWQAADRAGLLEHTSLVPRRLGHRELYMGADAIIQPQANGRSRPMLLEAMVHRIPVLARNDPWLDWLEHDVTAWLIDEPDADRWQALLQRLIDHRDQGRALGASASEHVAKRHVPAESVSATLELYRRVTGESMKFPGTESEDDHVDG